MKTRFGGKFVAPLIAALGFAVAIAAGYFLHPKVDEVIKLPINEWSCVVAKVDVSRNYYECVVYGKKDRGLEKYPNNRRGDDDKAQRTPIHAVE